MCSSDLSAAHPWLTLQHAHDAYVGAAGAIIHVLPGTYIDVTPAPCFDNDHEVVCIRRSGSAEHRLVFRCEDRDAGCLIRAANQGFMVEASYVDIDGFDYSAPAGVVAVGVYGGPVHADGGNSVHVVLAEIGRASCRERV